MKNEPDEMILSNTFMRTYGELRKGTAMTEASAELARVVQEVQNTGMPGELKITLKVEPNGEQEVAIIDRVEAKIPKKANRKTHFFIGSEGQLQRDDPRQTEMFGTLDGGKTVAQHAPVEAEAVAVNE